MAVNTPAWGANEALFPPSAAALMAQDEAAVAAAAPAAVTASDTVWFCVWLVESVPLTVNEVVATGVVAVVETVNVEEPEAPLNDMGFRLPVAPVGNPLTFKFTVPVKPLFNVTVTVAVAVPPAAAVRVLGVTEREKLLLPPPLGVEPACKLREITQPVNKRDNPQAATKAVFLALIKMLPKSKVD